MEWRRQTIRNWWKSWLRSSSHIRLSSAQLRLCRFLLRKLTASASQVYPACAFRTYMKPFSRFALFLAVLATAVLMASAQTSSNAADFAAALGTNYAVFPNITYTVADNVPLKLDIYQPSNTNAPTPVIVQIHGGGWVEGKKEEDNLHILPYLQMGWAVVNVEYRLARVSRAPAAVEDCRCALHWVMVNASKYNFDIHRVIVTGGSAGGHLALTSGMLPANAGFDRSCRVGENNAWTGPGGTADDPPVAAIVNWFGITDVLDMLHGPNARGYAIEWVGYQPNADELAKAVSPLTYVRKGLPAIITIHGTDDRLVPYEQAVRLHKELDAAGVPNQLYTVKGGGHGGFTAGQSVEIYKAIRTFLGKHVPATR
jgi:acetyl esterase/lipase